MTDSEEIREMTKIKKNKEALNIVNGIIYYAVIILGSVSAGRQEGRFIPFLIMVGVIGLVVLYNIHRYKR